MNNDSVILRGSFLSERRKSGSFSSESNAIVARNELIEELSSVLNDASNFSNSKIKEVGRQLGCFPDEKENNWYMFFNDLSGLEERRKNAAFVFGVDITGELTSVPFGRVFTSIISLLDQRYLGVIGSRFSDSVSRQIGYYISAQLAELSCFSLYTMMAERLECEISQLEAEENATVYNTFCEEIVDESWQSVVIRFPVLARLIYEKCINICNHFTTFVQRLKDDWEEINKYFGLGLTHDNKDNGILPIQKLVLGLSDPHNGGNSVIRLVFSNDKKIIYKPKPIDNESWYYNDFIDLCKSKGVFLPKLIVLSKQQYGWVDNITPSGIRQDNRGLDSNVAIGQIAAVSWLLGATDLHCENVIIDGDSIYLIDLETLFFTPTFAIVHEEVDNDTGNDLRNYGISVVETGLFHEAASEDISDLDPAGLFNEEVLESFPMPQFNVGVKGEILFGKNDNNNDGNSILGARFDIRSLDANEVSKSFKRTVEVLTADLELETLILSAPNLRIRFIARPTSFYYRIWFRLLQPKFLTDGALFSIELYKLFQDCLNLPDGAAAYLGATIQSEVLQIQRGDVPIFWVNFTEQSLMSNDGLVQKNYFHNKPINESLLKLRKVDGYLIEQNAKLLEASITVACEIKGNHDSKSDTIPNVTEPKHSLDDSIMFMVNELTTIIVKNAITASNKHSNWVSYYGAVDGSRLYPDASDQSYYGGYLGILCFICNAEVQLERHGWDTSLVSKFLKSEKVRLVRYVNQNGNKPIFLPSGAELGIGGAGGILLAAARMPNEHREMLAPLVDWLFDEGFNDILSSIEKDKNFDVINGCPGLLLGLSAYFGCHEKSSLVPHFDKMVNLTKSIYAKILLVAEQRQVGCAPWMLKNSPEQLVGFSHGGFGYAAALHSGLDILRHVEANSLNLDLCTRVKQQVHLTLECCNSYRINGDGLWQDNRWNVEGQINDSWCHGSTGIGFAYLRLKEDYSNSNDILKFIVRTVDQSLNSKYDCYCCGEAGKIDFLMEYNKQSNTQVFDVTERLENIFRNWRENGKYSGIWGATKGEFFPGLFQGSCGIAYVGMKYINPALSPLGM